MASQETVTIDSVLSMVKGAIRVTNVVPREGEGVAVSDVEVTLQLVRTRSAGAEAQWTVPVVGLAVGASGGRDWAASSTVTIQLVPPPPVQGRAHGFEAPDVAQELVSGIQTIREGILAAAGGEPVFTLSAASVTLSFEVTQHGSISLVAMGRRASTASHTLKLTLAPTGGGRTRHES